MSAAVHVWTDPVNRCAHFECEHGHHREAVTEATWQRVPVLGQKPTLRCEHVPHIPPSPATRAAHDRQRAILDLIAAADRLP